MIEKENNLPFADVSWAAEDSSVSRTLDDSVMLPLGDLSLRCRVAFDGRTADSGASPASFAAFRASSKAS